MKTIKEYKKTPENTSCYITLGDFSQKSKLPYRSNKVAVKLFKNEQSRLHKNYFTLKKNDKKLSNFLTNHNSLSEENSSRSLINGINDYQKKYIFHKPKANSHYSIPITNEIDKLNNNKKIDLKSVWYQKIKKKFKVHEYIKERNEPTLKRITKSFINKHNAIINPGMKPICEDN